MPVDPRALRILNSTFWVSGHWRHPRVMPSDEDFAYARDAGLMFDPVTIDHDQLPLQIRRLVRRIPLRDVVEAFVSSLSSRRLDLRSAITSYVIGRAMPIHTFPQRHIDKTAVCGVCGAAAFVSQPADWNRFSFERHHWGGVWINDPYYIAFDLERFAAGDHPLASDADWEQLRELLGAVRDASATDPELRPNGLVDVLRKVRSGSNESERRHLVTTLVAIGVLEPSAYPSFRSGWVDLQDRGDAPEPKSNWMYPVLFWRGRDGLDPAAVREFFPRLAI
jgi:hypothetical protein